MGEGVDPYVSASVIKLVPVWEWYSLSCKKNPRIRNCDDCERSRNPILEAENYPLSHREQYFKVSIV